MILVGYAARIGLKRNKRSVWNT